MPQDRDYRGRFKEGNQAARGRGKWMRPFEQNYLNILLDVLEPEQWRLIIEKMVKQAKRGSVKTAKFLASYAIGRPTVYVQADLFTETKPMDLETWQAQAEQRRNEVEDAEVHLDEGAD